MSTVPTDVFASIPIALEAARATLAPLVDGLADRVLSGDAEALTKARDVATALHALSDQVNAMISADARCESGELLTRALGLGDVLYAYVVAIGEVEHDDPAINARFAPARAEADRRLAELLAERFGESVEVPA
jgi:hypothetical protein